MENFVANSFDINYASAWSQDQGGFSSSLAQNLLKYIDANKINVKSCLDITCGTGEFLSYFSKRGIACYGTEVAKSMVDYCKEKYPTTTFALTKKMTDIPFKNKFDLISCNHDMVNDLEKASEWVELFTNACKALNKGGMFVFDYYTKHKLENWNEVIYEESADIDHVSQIKKGMDNKTIFTEVYYMKQPEGTYTKTFNIEVESYFENAQILDMLKKAGFKNVDLLTFSLEKIDDVESRNRIHVIAKK